MAVSPDFLPIAATCIGLVARRPRLVGRAFWALTAGLGTAGVLTVVLDGLDLLPSSFQVGEIGKASGAPAVLAINVAMLLVGGSLTLMTQQALTRRRPA